MKSIPVIVIQLVHILGPMKGEIQEFPEGSVLIGRDPACHLRFPADMTIISRKHAQIIREGNQFRLVDTSSNGTFVNGKRTTEAYLRNGDVLEFAEGGPKVSFLSEMREVQAETVPSPPPVAPQEFTAAPSAGPAPEPVQTPLPREIPKPVQPEPVQPRVEQPRIEQPQGVPVQKVSAPLIIQYGPTLRSYRELPVIIGRGPQSDFQLDHPAILDQHAQIFFAQNQYWIKDLTGQQPISINGRAVSMHSPLNVNDEISMSAQGPVFRFLGEGRLAEVEQQVPEAQPVREEKKNEPYAVREEKPSGKFLSRFKNFIDKKLQ
ncbi:MAG: FHA domain-containing protein [Nitrospirota bacterium]